MGSGHILVYAFDVLMQIYESAGYTRRDAARSIVENNLYGLDIDTRAYQLAYFAVMMKARGYNRRILDKENRVKCNLHVIQESNGINRDQLKYFGSHLSDMEKNTALLQIEELLDTMIDAKEYGSILKVNKYNWGLLIDFASSFDGGQQQTIDMVGIDETKKELQKLVEIASILARKFNIVITNPPYMGSSGMGSRLLVFTKKSYPDSKVDMFAIFIERCFEFASKNGFTSMITQHAFMFLSSFENLRLKILLNTFVNMIHLGARAFDEIGGEVVQTTSFIFRKSIPSEYRGTYIRLIEPTTQKGKEDMFLSGESQFVAKQNNFYKIPGSPIAYWISNQILSIYANSEPLGKIAAPRKGNSTSNNDRFLRLWHEVSILKINFGAKVLDRDDTMIRRWFPYNKGGGYRKWYGLNEFLIDWYNDAAEIRNVKTAVIANYQYFLKPGLTWSTVSSNRFSIRWFDEGFIFDNGGCCIFEIGENRCYLMSLLNSSVFEYIFSQLNPTLNFQSGEVAKFPVKITNNDRINALALRNVEISREDWDAFERSWDFKHHPLAQDKSIKKAYIEWENICRNRFTEVLKNEEELNRIFINIYGLEKELSPEVNERNISINLSNLSRDIKSFISYSIGCCLGRFSLDRDGISYAGGRWDSSNYNTLNPDADNIILITDEEYISEDIIGRFVEFVKVVYGPETLEENLDFIANALENKGNTSREVIRDYFVKDFFKDHCKTYQKRPIYWLFDSGKQNGFKALIYMHRYNEDTIGNLRIDYLHKIQRIYENEIRRMQDVIDSSSNAREVSSATKRKDKLLKQLQETKDYDEKIAHLALARTSIDLDDGVKVNYEKVQTDRDGNKLEVLAKI